MTRVEHNTNTQPMDYAPLAILAPLAAAGVATAAGWGAGAGLAGTTAAEAAAAGAGGATLSGAAPGIPGLGAVAGPALSGAAPAIPGLAGAAGGAGTLLEVLRNIPGISDIPGMGDTNIIDVIKNAVGGGDGGGNVVDTVIDAVTGGGQGGGTNWADLAARLANAGFLYKQYDSLDDDADKAAEQYGQAAQYLTNRINTQDSQAGEQYNLVRNLPDTNQQVGEMVGVADRLQGFSDADRADLKANISKVGQRNEALLESLGPRKMYGEADVNALHEDIFGKKVGQVDRALKLASSQGFADSLRRGLTDSTAAADTRDNVVRRFADTYSNLDAQSRGEAVSQVGNLSNLQTNQRSAAQSELASALNPELNARIQTYRPTEVGVTARGNGVSLNNQNTAARLGFVGNQNNTVLNGAQGLAENAQQLATGARTSAGEARGRLFSALAQNFAPAPTTVVNTGGASGGGGSSGGGNIGGTIADFLKKLFGG
jgi:hypothetical protein